MTQLTEDQIAARLDSLPGWTQFENTIHKTYEMDSYTAGLAFVSAVGTVCEGLNHHPDKLCVGWKKVQVVFTTHDSDNSLTSRDFDAADAVEALPYRKP